MRWLVLVLVLPVAAAQGGYAFDVGVVNSPGTLASGEAEWLFIPYTVSCGDASPGAGQARISFVFDTPEGIGTSGVLGTTPTLPDCPGPDVQGEHRIQLVAHRDAPGLVPLEIGIDATLTLDGPTGRSVLNGTTGTTVDVAYRSEIIIGRQGPLPSVAPGETTAFVFNVTNLGNARTTVSVQADDERLSTPPAVSLDVGETEQVTVGYAHPSDAGADSHTMTVTFAPRATSTAEGGTPVEQTISVRSAASADAPAVPIPWLVAAIGALALLRRQP